ncbi:conserved hypothetical protein [Candidatus Magnetomoraceae bacterium gMMP-15]
MSNYLNLVKYQTDKNEKFYEEGCELIESVFITPALLQEIESYFPLVELDVHEEEGTDEKYKIECFDNKDISNILNNLLEDFFLVLHESKKILDSSKNIKFKAVETSIKKPMTYLFPLLKKNIKADLQLSIDRFRTITNVIYIFKLKKDKYENDSSTVLKIG